MFKNSWVVFLSTILLFVSCSQNPPEKKGLPADKGHVSSGKTFPGYYEQWLYIKSGGTNVLPDMSKYKWHTNSAKRANPTALINVYEYGPTNVAGRIRGIIVDYSNPARIIVGAASGGVFLSENNGSSWKPVNDQALSPSVTWLAQNPFLPNVMYYCTGEYSGNSADLDGKGVFKSVDGGKTFEQLPATNNANFRFNWSVKCSPADTHTLYVATNGTGLWRSQDNGESFTRVYNTGQQINDLEVFPDGSVMFTIKGTGVYRSTSGNLGSFSKNMTIPSNATARGELAYCKNYPNIVYAAISGPDNGYSGVLKAFYKSSDGGKTFVEKTNPTGKVNFGFTWYALCMSVNDNDSNDIFIGSLDIGNSTDGGVTWTSGDEQHADNHVAVNSGSNLYLGSDGGLARYNWSNFKSYTSLNNNLNITQFYAGDVSPHEPNIIGGCQDNGTKESRNLSKSFSSVNGADGGYTFYHSSRKKTKYYSMQNGVVIRSSGTSGSNRTISNNLPTNDAKWFIHPYHVSEHDGNIVVYPANQRLYYSVDSGASFMQIHMTSSGRLFSAATSAGSNPAVYTGGDGMFVVVDSASNLSPKGKEMRQKMPLGIRASFIGSIKVIPGYRDKVYLGFSNVSDSGRIYVASNLFADTPVFKNISGDLPKGLPVNWVECDPLDPERVIFAGTDYGLYITENGGLTWVKDTRIPSTVISNIRVHRNMKDIYFFTHGRGVFKGQINNNAYSSVNRPLTNAGEPRVYPNPAAAMCKLAFASDETGIYTVYDIQGKSVQNGVIEGATTVIPTASLPGGSYILMYRIGSGTGSLRISVLN